MVTFGMKLTPTEEKCLTRAAVAEGLTVNDYIKKHFQVSTLDSTWEYDESIEDDVHWEDPRLMRLH